MLRLKMNSEKLERKRKKVFWLSLKCYSTTLKERMKNITHSGT